MRLSGPSATFWLCALVIAGALLGGGGSQSGFVGDVTVQLIAVPLLVGSLQQWIARIATDLHECSAHIILHVAVGLLLVLLVVQLNPWAVGSITPHASWAAAASLIPFFAVFLGVSQLDAEEQFKLSVLIVGLGAIALLIGFLQVANGPQSSLRFFAITNPSEAVGFFANRNHFAAQLYSTLVFAAVLLAFSTKAFLTRASFNTHAVLWVIGSASLAVALLTGIMLARSRAGFFLAIAAVIGIAGIYFASQRRSRQRSTHKLGFAQPIMLAGLALSVLFAAQLGFHHIATRFGADAFDDYRVVLSPETFTLALKNMPLGTGLGSFPLVFAQQEKSEHLLTSYANRAHNDWFELWLETGILGVAICGLFIAWFALRTIHVFRLRASGEIDHHLMLRRGAALAVGLLLAHSAVDYPLRTTAMSVVFAFSCALLASRISPRHSASADQLPRRSKRLHSKARGMRNAPARMR